MYFFVFFFLDSVSPPPHIHSAFTSKLQQLYKEGRPRKVRSGKHVVGRSETGYQLCLGVPPKGHISVEKDKLEDITGCVNQFPFNQYHLAQQVPGVCACI